MKSKLTLSIEKETKERAKHYARQHGTSVSEMVERFLEAISQKKSDWEPSEGSVVGDLLGSVPDKDKREYDDIIVEEIVKRFGVCRRFKRGRLNQPF